MNRYWLRSLAVLMVLCFAVSFYATAEELDPSQYYYSLDRESKDELPGNIRFVTKGEYELKEQSYRPGRTSTPSYYPKTDGMDTLNISGSQQYAAGQFAKLADRIKELAAREGIEKVIIVDLRQEFHAFLDAEESMENFVNGSSVSFYGPGNAANKDKGLDKGDDLIAAEKANFDSLIGTEVAVHMRSSGGRPPEGSGSGTPPGSGSGGGFGGTTKTVPVMLGGYSTEEELATEAGFKYLRIAATDRLWPQPVCIDEFIDYVKPLDMNKTWLHFHCLAGMGRTATFMVIYDIMKNPSVDLKDIVYRHSMMGGENLLQSSQLQEGIGKSKADMVRLIYQYIQENRNDRYNTPWSVWLQTYNEAEESFKAVLHLRAGQRIRIPGNGAVASSNETAVSVSDMTLTAERAGDSEITVTNPGEETAVYRVEVWDDFAELVLPNGLTTLKNGAFFGVSRPVAVTLGDRLENVEAGVFEETGKLQITVKSNETMIDKDAFGALDTPVFLCDEQSEAAAFAIENGYMVFYLLP